MSKYQFYRGYVKSDGKTPLEPFNNKKIKDSELRTSEECERLDSYCGVLSLNTVLIDIDVEKQSVVLMNIVKDLHLRCRVVKTTRGMHFLFLNDDKISKPNNGIKLACGLKADIKIGMKNGVETLKKNGVKRKTVYDISPDEEYESVPLFLLPVDGTHLKGSESGKIYTKTIS